MHNKKTLAAYVLPFIVVIVTFTQSVIPVSVAHATSVSGVWKTDKLPTVGNTSTALTTDKASAAVTLSQAVTEYVDDEDENIPSLTERNDLLNKKVDYVYDRKLLLVNDNRVVSLLNSYTAKQVKNLKINLFVSTILPKINTNFFKKDYSAFQRNVTRALSDGSLTSVQASALSAKVQEINGLSGSLKGKTLVEKQLIVEKQIAGIAQVINDQKIPASAVKTLNIPLVKNVLLTAAVAQNKPKVTKKKTTTTKKVVVPVKKK